MTQYNSLFFRLVHIKKDRIGYKWGNVGLQKGAKK